MQSTAHDFKQNAAKAMADVHLRKSLKRVETNYAGRRAAAVARMPEFEVLRDQARNIKNHVLEHLDVYLDRFEQQVIAAGGQVHWCKTAAEARETILSLCRSVSAKTVTKSKSMTAEEIALNDFLAANDVEPIETDIGEYIIQLAGEPPSHLIGPAIHKTKEQVAQLFFEHHQKYGEHELLTEGKDLVGQARRVLRPRFFAADVGITGANMLIAETGTAVVVTNEGNADLTQTLPKMHIVLAAIEKLVPTYEDASTILRVLARSATGQETTVYTTFAAGPRRPGDADGPESFHVVLLDSGRSAIIGTETQDVLRCIRCAACMNHCPVYHSVGGHAYGWVYPGPIGAALDPHFLGIKESHELPEASTFCGRCEEVCPMRIPLPRIMRHWREQAFESAVTPPVQRYGIKIWAWFARRPKLYALGAGIAMRALGLLGGSKRRFRSLPLAGAWTNGRDFPAPEGPTFRSVWKARRARSAVPQSPR